jgi:glycosyltransferase involved in cell wall biosynthesis
MPMRAFDKLPMPSKNEAFSRPPDLRKMPSVASKDALSADEKLRWPWKKSTARPRHKALEDWPRISVITPSYNQGRFIEQTIRSVIMQDYPNLEYIIMDGGSTDASVEIIKKYEQQLAYWESQSDRGQSHAINKGFARATGDILCWLNSDDYFLPDTLQTVGEIFADSTDDFALVGHCIQVYEDGRPPLEATGKYEGLDRLLQFWKGYRMHQPSIFWRREVFERVGYLDESLNYTMDFDYWVRIARHFSFTNIDRALSYSTYHAQAKTGDNYASYYDELMRRAPTYWPRTPVLTYYRMKISMYWHMVVQPKLRRLRVLAAYYPRRAWSLLSKPFTSQASA